MAKPYIQYFQVNTHNIDILTSIVIDKPDFDAVCDEIFQHESKILSPSDAKPVLTEDGVKALKEAGHIPLIKKGTKTQWLFDKFNIREDVSYLSMIVRGKGRQIAAALQAQHYQNN